MGTVLIAAWYLTAVAHRRLNALTRSGLRAEPTYRAHRRDGGALSLEWIAIAGIVFAAAVAAGIVFNKAISAETSKLP
jgi:hypothetical protein